jgi:hypothetical protein
MSDNSWIIPISVISGVIVIGLGVSMYKNNKESLAAEKKFSDFLDKDDIESKVGGGKSKRRKHRKNASKKRR